MTWGRLGERGWGTGVLADTVLEGGRKQRRRVCLLSRYTGWPRPGLCPNHAHCSPCRGLQKDYRTDRVFGTNVPCWFVHNSGKGFIDGHYKDYFVPQLYSFLKWP